MTSRTTARGRWVRTVTVAAGLLALTGVSAITPTVDAAASGATVVSLTFDDGYTFHVWVAQQLASRGMHGTFYLASGLVDAMDGSAMTWSQAQALVQAGQEVGGHTRDHIDLTSTAYTYAQKYQETCGDRDELVSYGLNPVTFDYPYGSNDAASQALVRSCGYEAARTTAGLAYARSPYAETIPPANPYAIRALSDLAPKNVAHPTAADLEQAVTAVIAHGGGWLPLVFHGVCIPGWDNYDACWALGDSRSGHSSVDATQFTQFLDWLRTQPVSVKALGEVVSPGGVLPPPVSITTARRTGTSRLEVSGTASSRPVDRPTVTVNVFAGSYATGTPIAKATATASAGTWSAVVTTPLEGTYTIVARQADSYGAIGSSNEKHLYVDTRAPQVTSTPLPLATLASSVPLSWSAVDAGTGVKNYDVRYRRAAYSSGFEPWTTPSGWGGTTATHVSLPVAIGYDYCYEVRSRDVAGNYSAWTAARCVARALDDRSMTATAGWVRRTSTAYYRQTFTQTGLAGQTLTRTGAQLDRVGLVVTKSPTSGIVAVYVGGTWIGRVNLYASTTARQQIVMLPRFSYRLGTVLVRTVSSGKPVQIDGLVVSRT